MFLYLSVILFTGVGVHPLGRHPLAAPRADAPLGRHHPAPYPEMGTEAGTTHPIGMHSCLM